MIPPRFAFLLIVPALFSTAALVAQGTAPADSASSSPASCARGAADEDGMSIALTLPGTPEHAAALLDSVLRAQEYSIAQPLAGAGAWSAEPSHRWRAAYAEAVWHGPEHPGLRMSGGIKPNGDSVEVTLLSRALCRSEAVAGGGAIGAPEELLERFAALDLIRAVADRPDPSRAFRLDIPRLVGEFAFEDAVEDSGGIVMSFGAMNTKLSVTVSFVSLGLPRSTRCTPACAGVEVQKAVANHIRRFAWFRGAGVSRSMDALAPGAEDRWTAGAFVTTRSADRVNHLYVYAVPSHVLTFASFIGDTPGGAERVRAFVATALASGMAKEATSPPPGRRRRN